jgi:hypothetical protein
VPVFFDPGPIELDLSMTIPQRVHRREKRKGKGEK